MARRRKLVAGNWKMHGLRADLPEIAAIDAAAAAHGDVDVALCVPATMIALAADAAEHLAIGAQDCHGSARGAHTGCLSADMLHEAGARLVIVGHSERRADQNETSHDAWAKAAAARAEGMEVILCVGETGAERDAGRAARVVQAQMEKAVPEDASGDWFTLAYEPRWAIGTGQTPTADEIAAIHAVARDRLAVMLGAEAAAGIRILYGGSVSAANAAAILRLPDVDGALVGGASLSAAKFVPIIEAAAQA